jgi:predicted NBD/HSP70 family sugar kinase
MYAAVDIGGTKTLIIVFDDTGKPVEQVKFSTPPVYDDFLTEMEKFVDKLSTKDFRAIGVAAPGRIDHKQGLLRAAGNLGWKNEPIQSDFEKLFRTPVVLENDAKAAALAEARYAGPNYETVVYITISTGVGIGVCENGSLDKSLEDAEVGWMTVEHNGQAVPWEKIASGSAIVQKYGKRASELDDPVAWDEIAHNIAIGLITVIAITQPDLIVFGGGVGNHLQKFEQPLLKHLKEYENPMVTIPPIKKSTHPEEAVAYGCFELAKDFATV